MQDRGYFLGVFGDSEEVDLFRDFRLFLDLKGEFVNFFLNFVIKMNVKVIILFNNLQ